MITWIVGEGGLLGSALARRVSDRFRPRPVPWHEPADAARLLRRQAADFLSVSREGPWRVIWAAGAATTATPRSETLAELESLRALLDGLSEGRDGGRGTFFLASSAGGVYAGSVGPPFSVATTPRPLSPYGELKLAQEHLVTEALGASSRVVIGRLSNLYGPGQNHEKLQGLVSRLALATITRQPVNIFVPLGTIRDYLYSDDAASAILRLLETVEPGPGLTTHVIATGRGTTIGQLLRTTSEVAKRRVPVALGSHGSAAAQAADLRLVPSANLPETTTLPEGVKAVHDDLLVRLQRSSLAH